MTSLEYNFSHGPPLTLGSVFGVRLWNWNLLHKKLEPVSTRVTVDSRTLLWEPGENKAICAVPSAVHYEMVWNEEHTSYVRKMHFEWRDENHTLDQCSHGFYAYWRRFKKDLEYGGEVSGVIEGYGVTAVGTLGFRCEKARIVGLSYGTRTRSFSGGRWFDIKSRIKTEVQLAYPDIPFYETYPELLRAHPPTTAEEVIG